MRKNKGQSILEYTVIMVIILGVMIAMKDYVKRGIQGRWKSASDDFGEQYDPQSVNSSMLYASQVNSQSQVTTTNDTVNGAVGQWTSRTDLSNSADSKAGFTQVGN